MKYPFQDSLPKQPVPSLEKTCEYYLQMLAPLLNETDLARTKEQVKIFQQQIGPQLQQQLETIAASTQTSYIYNFLHNRLLEHQSSLFHQNFSSVLMLDSSNNNVPFAKFVAGWIVSLLRFYLKIKQGEFAPNDDVRRKPFGIHEYLKFFGQTRIPGVECDTLQQASASKHIVVIRRNVFYLLTLLNSDVLPNIADIAQQINWILEQSVTGEPAIGLLTSMNRERWMRLRSHLVAYDSKNSSTLDIIDNALFVVCLDESIPPHIEATTKNALYSDGGNRWFDKSLQLIFTPDNQLALNIEHAELDGYPTLRFFADVNQYYQQLEDEQTTTFPGIYPKPLQWNLSDEILKTIKQAEENAKNLIDNYEMRVLEIKEFGRRFIAKQQLHADALVQLSLQLTYFRLYGKMVSSYEPIAMGHFRYGRVEGIRSVTAESLQLMKTLTENIPNNNKWQALKKANDTHVSLLANIMNGKTGGDRYLFALHSLARQQGIKPDIFMDKVYREIFSKSPLSTTSLPNLSLDCLINFHPEVADGYAIFYSIKPDKIYFTITSQQQEIDKFVDLLKLSLSELVNLKSQ
ncbi:MAG: choline/carnitine O-acyltransferase [Pseudomonadota bacterium]